MGVTVLHQTFKTKVTPERMFRALILNSHNLCPKLMFSSVSDIVFVSGQGEVGSIKQINFTEASPLRYIKHRIDMMDEAHCMCKYTLIEAEPQLDNLEYVTYEVKFERYGLTGCVCKLTSEYVAKEGIEIKEEDIEHGKDRAIGMYEVVEAYLMAHPHAYTTDAAS